MDRLSCPLREGLMLDGILGSCNKQTGQLKVGGWGSPIEGYCVVQISILIFPLLSLFWFWLSCRSPGPKTWHWLGRFELVHYEFSIIVVYPLMISLTMAQWQHGDLGNSLNHLFQEDTAKSLEWRCVNCRSPLFFLCMLRLVWMVKVNESASACHWKLLDGNICFKVKKWNGFFVIWITKRNGLVKIAYKWRHKF